MSTAFAPPSGPPNERFATESKPQPSLFCPGSTLFSFEKLSSHGSAVHGCSGGYSSCVFDTKSTYTRYSDAPAVEGPKPVVSQSR